MKAINKFFVVANLAHYQKYQSVLDQINRKNVMNVIALLDIVVLHQQSGSMFYAVCNEYYLDDLKDRPREYVNALYRQYVYDPYKQGKAQSLMSIHEFLKTQTVNYQVAASEFSRFIEMTGVDITRDNSMFISWDGSQETIGLSFLMQNCLHNNEYVKHCYSLNQMLENIAMIFYMKMGGMSASEFLSKKNHYIDQYKNTVLFPATREKKDIFHSLHDLMDQYNFLNSPECYKAKVSPSN